MSEPDRYEVKAREICAERGIENAKTRRILADALRAVEAETRQACIDACDDAIGALQGDREVEAALECIKRIRALASPAAAPDKPAEKPHFKDESPCATCKHGLFHHRTFDPGCNYGACRCGGYAKPEPATAPAAEPWPQPGRCACRKVWLGCGHYATTEANGEEHRREACKPAPPSEPAAPERHHGICAADFGAPCMCKGKEPAPLLPRVLAAMTEAITDPGRGVYVSVERERFRSLAAELRAYIAERGAEARDLFAARLATQLIYARARIAELEAGLLEANGQLCAEHCEWTGSGEHDDQCVKLSKVLAARAAKAKGEGK